MYDLTDKLAVVRVTEPSVRTFVDGMLTGLGANAEEARINADGIVSACLWWHPGQGQGLGKMFRYARRMRNGGIVPDARMRWVTARTSTALLDAAKGLGYVSAHRAMTKAIEKARTTGIAMVGVQHSNHFGVAMTNAGAEMAPWGSAEPVLGTNPWGMSVPRPGGRPPIVLDMALTMSGKGMMGWFQREGIAIPDSWALTPDGRTTTDPNEAMDGPLLPIGAYKGYGLSLITDILTGVLTGSLFGADVFQDDTDFDVAHTMIAVDPEAFMDRGLFDTRLERLIADVVGAKPIDPGRPVQLPGEAEQRREVERRRHGVPVDRENFVKLEALASEVGVPFTLERVD